MPLFIINDDITKLKVDAIVNAANESLLGGGGVDGCIHRAAGPELLKECRTLNGCPTGKAKITKGYKLPAKYVIHTVGPIWHGGNYGEEDLLKSCYNESLKLAVENKCQSIAFPMISAGVFGYPKYLAMKVAQSTINSFLCKLEDDIDVYIVLFGKDTSDFFDIEKGIKSYLDKNLITDKTNIFDWAINACTLGAASVGAPTALLKSALKKEKVFESCESCCEKSSLDDALNNSEESFSSMIMRKIKESGLDEVACYKAANLNKQIFSKIRSSAGEIDNDIYQPTKSTALSFAIALKLDLEESKDLLEKAGFAFSKNNKTDIIVEYCISNHINDIFRVNEILFSYGQPVLGSKCY
ncbi:MAG: O-acetyl-ADP-ribose deacetylase [Candidatus Riflebacteria bacterium]|nr:O-acetyl-ADP-ribose deacetylase [Candidatus Riflebacteria bacterium]MBR4569162.1 O-acetyl-ADP-ribose deacetylase [Candidatus Riflebacteria bacterium]